MICEQCGNRVKYRIDMQQCPICQAKVNSVPIKIELTVTFGTYGDNSTERACIAFNNDEYGRDYHTNIECTEEYCFLYYQGQILGNVEEAEAVSFIQTIYPRVIYPLRIISFAATNDSMEQKYKLRFEITYHEKRDKIENKD